MGWKKSWARGWERRGGSGVRVGEDACALSKEEREIERVLLALMKKYSETEVTR